MGACVFTEVVRVGKSGISGAFNSAVKQALYDFGHAGYTGTIAEKNSFVLIKDVGTRKEAMELAEKLIDEDDDRICDKWGPAGAITFKQDGRPAVVFFGWVSE